MTSIFKSAAAILIDPLLVAFVLVIVGLLCLRRHRQRLGRSLIAVGALWAYLASTPLVGNALLAPLEHRYQGIEATESSSVREIVVLGSGYEPGEHIPVTGALAEDGLARIVEAVRIARLQPDTRLILSGGAPQGYTPSAWGYVEMATQLGISRSAIVVADRPLDTAEEARAIVGLLGNRPFILVTSAYHMPRAMILMRRAGANPVPAPTGQMLHTALDTKRFGLTPSSRGLRKTEIALHEYLGMAAIACSIQ